MFDHHGNVEVSIASSISGYSKNSLLLQNFLIVSNNINIHFIIAPRIDLVWLITFIIAEKTLQNKYNKNHKEYYVSSIMRFADMKSDLWFINFPSPK